METKTATQPAFSPYIVLTLGVVAVSFSAPLVRMTAAPPAVAAFYRLLITCVLLAPMAIRRRAEFKAVKRKDFLFCILSGVFLSFHFVFWFTSLGLTSVSSAALLVNIHPLVVISAGWLLFNEKFRPSALPWAGVALVGMAVLGWEDMRSVRALPGNLLAVAGGLMIAGYYLTGRKVRPRVSISVYSLLVYGASTILLLGYNLAAAKPLTGYSPVDWLVFAALAVAPTIFGHTLLNWSLKYLPAGAISVSVLGEPVIATILAIPWLGEIPGPLHIAGGLLVIGGIWVFLKRS